MTDIRDVYTANPLTDIDKAASLFYLGDDPGGTPADGAINKGNLFAQIAKEVLSYKLNVTVSANDLIVALVHNDGSTPSADRPLLIKIGNTWRSVTAATSITLADATNWGNVGSAELATKEIDWFAYAVWDSNSSIVAIAPSRISHGRLVSDFSATTTNEKYLGNYANFTTTDEVVNIGRFAATLSAGAGYTWTVPTFTNLNLVHQPIFETRLLNWTPVHTRTGGAYTNTPTVSHANYQVVRNRLMVYERHTQNATPGSSGNQQFTLPFSNTAIGAAQDFEAMNGVAVTMFKGSVADASNAVTLYKYDGTSEATASNVYRLSGEIFL